MRMQTKQAEMNIEMCLVKGRGCLPEEYLALCLGTKSGCKAGRAMGMIAAKPSDVIDPKSQTRTCRRNTMMIMNPRETARFPWVLHPVMVCAERNDLRVREATTATLRAATETCALCVNAVSKTAPTPWSCPDAGMRSTRGA